MREFVITILGFPAFACLWIFITFVLSQSAWAKLAKHFKFDGPFEGTRIGVTISARINEVSYSNVLIMKCNAQGLYLYTVVMFKLFHPPILIPYSAIVRVTEKKFLFSRSHVLTIGNPVIATMMVNHKTLTEMQAAMAKYVACVMVFITTSSIS